jgi:hypothetical protein
LTRVDPGVEAWARVALRHARPNRRNSAGWRAVPRCLAWKHANVRARARVPSFESDGFERKELPGRRDERRAFERARHLCSVPAMRCGH